MEEKECRVFIAGHNGMVGSAIKRKLEKQPSVTIYTVEKNELNLFEKYEVQQFLERNRINHVYLAAARVGGIFANNTYPVDFIRDNLLIQLSMIDAVHSANVDRLLFLGSSCIYPKLAPQPMPESALLLGKLEPTNEPYAIAKIAGIKLCESYNRQYGTDYRSVMPTNLYGPNDNFHPENSHVLPALIRRFHEAKESNDAEVVVWGSGKAMREFLFVDDMAEACIHMLNIPQYTFNASVSPLESHVNLGTGLDCTIAELAQSVSDVVGYQGNIKFDTSKPDGTPRKLLDVSKAEQLGWKANTSLKNGLEKTYRWFCETELAGELRV